MQKIGRNSKCPCGSGKKYKFCCLGKKRREQRVYIGHREPFQGITYDRDGSVSVNLPSGETVKADYVFSQSEYDRESGKPKVVSSISSRMVLDIPTFIAKNHDAIIALDTNSIKIGEDIVSVTASSAWHVLRISETQVRFQDSGHGILAFKNCPNGEAEKCAWYKLINIITSNPGFLHRTRVAVITDHDLGNLSRYNSRELPIYGDYFLPTNFVLYYASAETGQKSYLNTLIGDCEKESSRLLRQLKQDGTFVFDDKEIKLSEIPNIQTP